MEPIFEYSEPAAAAPSPAPRAITPQVVEPTTQAGLSPSEAAEATAFLQTQVAAGKLTPELAAKDFDQLGIPVDQRVDRRTDAAMEQDAQGFAPATPEQYTEVRLHDPREEPTPEQRQGSTMIRGWMSEAGLPRELGNSLFKTADEVARKTAVMTPHELEQFGLTEMTKLRAQYGDTLPDKLHAASRMIQQLELKQPGLKQLLKTQGLGDSARVVALILDQAERFWARRR